MDRKIAKKTVDKYKRIIDEWFVNGFNGTQAYKKFYPRIKKDETATVNFSRLHALPELKCYIEEKNREAAKIVQMTHEGILKELQNWVQSDITETLSLSIDELKELPVEIRRLIIKYKVTDRDIYGRDGNVIETVKTIELQFVSKERAIDMINKHLGFYEIDNKQKANSIIISASNDEHKKIIENLIEGAN